MNLLDRLRPITREKIKHLAIYPFLYILFIILTPLAHNLEHLGVTQAVKPLILLEVLAAALVLLLYRVFKDGQYASYLVFLLILYAFGFSYLNRLIQDLLANFGRTFDERVVLAVFTVFIGILAYKRVWRRLGGQTWMVPYLNLVFLIWLFFPVYELSSGIFLKPAQARSISIDTQAKVGEFELDCSNTPDIYYIILDAYGRSDALLDLYRYDNQAFLDALKGKGFYIAEGSFTNYTQTIFSIPSSLNFDYVDPPGVSVRGLYYFSNLIRQNEIMTALKHCGYQTVSIESGFFYTDHLDTDVYFERVIGFNEFESLLLADSPLDVMADDLNLEPSDYSYDAHRQRILYSFETLGSLPTASQPQFVFAHIIAPHPPFLFGSDGRFINPPYPYYIGDGDDFPGSLEDYKTGYSEQIQFINQKLLQLVDTILANSDKPPIIILQGDHGPGSRLIWDNPGGSCLWERTPILNAYYFPGQSYQRLYPSISPVNTFRVVLNTFFGTGLPYLPDLTYFTSHRMERQAIDITATRTAKANCYPP